MSAPYPTEPAASNNEVYSRYLDYFRTRLITKCRALSDEQVRAAAVPSGWTPLGLLNHMRYVELRWLVWGFAGETFDGDIFADQHGSHWSVDAEATLDELDAALEAQGARSREIIAKHSLADVSQPGEAWDEGEDPATLERILMHLVQEYAHHAGHLDIVVEMAQPQNRS
ncbi:MAG TPA: DinB family protein [Micromonosporaceae bacterium]|jgi:uncharacterized damage-inducible protein DinB